MHVVTSGKEDPESYLGLIQETIDAVKGLGKYVQLRQIDESNKASAKLRAKTRAMDAEHLFRM